VQYLDTIFIWTNVGIGLAGYLNWWKQSCRHCPNSAGVYQSFPVHELLPHSRRLSLAALLTVSFDLRFEAKWGELWRTKSLIFHVICPSAWKCSMAVASSTTPALLPPNWRPCLQTLSICDNFIAIYSLIIIYRFDSNLIYYFTNSNSRTASKRRQESTRH